MSEQPDWQVIPESGREDFGVLQHMLDPSAFPDRVFGFHAQQAVEKGLKAWIGTLRAGWPFVHEIRTLLTLLADLGADAKRFETLARWSEWAT